MYRGSNFLRDLVASLRCECFYDSGHTIHERDACSSYSRLVNSCDISKVGSKCYSDRVWSETEAQVRRNWNEPATRPITKSRAKTANIRITVVSTRDNRTLYRPNIIFLFDERPVFVSSTYSGFIGIRIQCVLSWPFILFHSNFIRSDNGQTNSVLIIEWK